MTAPAAEPVPAGPGPDTEERTDERTDELVEGSGIVSSYYDVGEAVDEQDAAGVAWAAAAAGLDTLGFVADPFGSLTSAGIGWAIEHVGFLREPLDALAGNPAEITDIAARVRALSEELLGQATAVRSAAGDAGRAWEGAAATGFCAAATADAAAAARIAEQAAQTAELVLGTGAMIGAERALLRDAVADFLASLVTAGVLSVITAGTAAPVTVAGAVLDAVELAHGLGDRVQKLIDAVREAAGIAARIEAALGRTITELGRTVEHGKQDAAARASTTDGRAEPPA